ncbi:MAG: outer membrane-stress sensor serine endopeptidase DegS, partial [Arsenophonus sp.]|nr:outer membrane-stress sensor serine endopeptidase DegS [Arsenophonus sp.]
MFIKLFRAVIVGLVIATILLMAIPSIRPKGLTNLLDDKKDEQPISYSKAVRRAAPAVVYVYSSGTGSFSQNGRELTALGSGVIMSSNG